MARNMERDTKEADRRKRQLLETGFRLFAEKGIETVKLQEVADKADVSASTMYNYYQNKVNLAIAISVKKWTEFWEESLKKHSLEELESFNAYELIEFYDDQIISLYKEHPEVLKFSQNYKTYIEREGASEEQLKTQMDALSPINELFHKKYEQAKQDKSIRTDLPEGKLFAISAIHMLAIAERYAAGLVWGNDHTNDHIQELESTKQMMLDWMKSNTGKSKIEERGCGAPSVTKVTVSRLEK